MFFDFPVRLQILQIRPEAIKMTSSRLWSLIVQKDQSFPGKGPTVVQCLIVDTIGGTRVQQTQSA